MKALSCGSIIWGSLAVERHQGVRVQRCELGKAVGVELLDPVRDKDFGSLANFAASDVSQYRPSPT